MKKEHTKITKNTIPEDFTIGLCIVDAIPVLLFCINCVVIGTKIDDLVFIFGALLCLWAGTAKVMWKFLVVLRHKNVWWMFLQLRFFMPIGFLLMITGFILDKVSISAVFCNIFSFPQCIFFALAVICFILLAVFAFTLKTDEVKANWTEQITNSLAQVFIFAGLLIMA